MFKQIKSVSIPQYNGNATMYQHECGMEVLHIKNNSEELCGSFAFTTVSEDNTGLAHILEHTVLCGSEKYPVKDPFSQILKTSPNTFLNAMTFPDKTLYPFASPLKKDFDIIFDIYADAVFAPLLRKESFQQEGVRFCSGSIDGVVFNEMRGALSSEDSIVSSVLVKKLFEGTPAEFESGGDPVYIPDLTYEEYLKRYRKWYSPANCRLFLYGNMDAEEYLDKIEKNYLTQEHLSKYENKKLFAVSQDYLNPKAQPVRDVRTCPAKEANSVLLNWLIPKPFNSFDLLVLSILTDILLGNPGAPLYKAMIESSLGEDLSACSGMESDYPVLSFSVGLSGAKKNSEQDIEKLILTELEKLATDGIDMPQQLACMKRQKFRLKEIPGDGFPFGLLVAIRAARCWTRGGDPIEAIDTVSLFDRLEKEFEKGRFFENWIMENLVNNPRRCLLTVKEDPDFDSKLQDILNSKFNRLKDSCGETEYLKESKAYEAFVEMKDSPENLAKIPRISRADLPEQIPCFALDSEMILGSEIKSMNTFTRGITYMNFAFDATSLDKDELELLTLFSRALQMCGTKKHTYSEIGVLTNTYTGRFSISVSNGTKQNGDYAVYLILKTSALTEEVPQALDLVREVLLEADFSAYDRLLATITDLITDWESEYLEMGTLYASMYCDSFHSSEGMVNDLLNGTKGYLAVKKLAEADSTEIRKLSKRLSDLREKLICRKKMIAEFCCDKENNNEVRANISKNLSLYPEGQTGCYASFYKEPFKPDYSHRFLSVSGGPAYNVMVTKLPFEDEKRKVCTSLICGILNSDFMVTKIRGQGGAYGAICNFDLADKKLICASYRDPNIEKTFDWFKAAFESEITEQNIEYYVSVIIGKELKPFVPKAKSYEAFKRALYGFSDELYLERRRQILLIGVEDVREVCESVVKQMKDASSTATLCGSEMIKDENSKVLSLPI